MIRQADKGRRVWDPIIRPMVQPPDFCTAALLLAAGDGAVMHLPSRVLSMLSVIPRRGQGNHGVEGSNGTPRRGNVVTAWVDNG